MIGLALVRFTIYRELLMTVRQEIVRTRDHRDVPEAAEGRIQQPDPLIQLCASRTRLHVGN